MKPFDLEAAKRGEPICFSDGTPVRFLAYVQEMPEHNRVVVVAKSQLYTRAASGKIHPDLPAAIALDLCMAPKKRTVWVNLYSNRESFHYNTEKEADSGHNHLSKLCFRVGNRAWPLEIEE